MEYIHLMKGDYVNVLLHFLYGEEIPCDIKQCPAMREMGFILNCNCRDVAILEKLLYSLQTLEDSGI